MLLERLASPFRTFGPFAGALYAIDRALVRMGPDLGVHYYELMAQPVADKPFLSPRLAKSFEIREIKRDDPAAGDMPLTPDVLAYRFGQPTVCLGAFRKGRLIGYMWLCLGTYQEDEVRCTFVPEADSGAVWDFGLYVFPEDRLGLAFVALWDGANVYLRDRGYRYSLSRVSRFNLTSRRAHEHFKWRCLGRAVFVTLKRVQIMVATVPPYLHLSLGESSAPVIRLRA